MADIKLRSPAFDHQAEIPRRHAHHSDNVSPALEWSGVPEGAAELLLLCEDPDAAGGTFLHWLVTGIDPSTTGVGENEIPQGGREWLNDFREVGWGGPQPPFGDRHHRYIFRVYALSRPVELPRRPSADDVHEAIRDIVIASGELVGLYER